MLAYSLYFIAKLDTNTYICHHAGGQVLPNPYLLASVGTEEVAVLVVRYSSLYGWHINLVATQSMQVDENRSLVT